MTPSSVASPAATARRPAGQSGLRNAGPALAAGFLAWAALFFPEAAAAVRVWADSTAYNHCFLIIPIALYLLHDRRAALRDIAACPTPWAALLGLPIAILWLAADRLGVMEGRQLMAVSFAQVLFLSVLGWRMWWALSGPLLYLYFLVPFGEFLVPVLQDLTAVFVSHGLPILGIPAYIDGYTIEIPEGTFYVAEACAGLRFLVASVAFGVLYALLMYRTPLRRGLFMIVSIVVPLVANGFRALGIVTLGHWLGSAEAAAADHLLYGWIFFSLVIGVLIVLGLPFRQDNIAPGTARENATEQPGARRFGSGGHSPWGAVAVTALIAGIGPAVAAGLNQAGAAHAHLAALPAPEPGCQTVSAGPAQQLGQGIAVLRHVTCGVAPLEVVVVTFSPHVTAEPILAARRALTRPPGAEDVRERALPIPRVDGADWRVVQSNDPAYLSVAAMWVDGQPTWGGLRMRVQMAWQSLLGSAHAPILVVVRPPGQAGHGTTETRQDTERQIVSFLLGYPAFSAQIAGMAVAGAGL